MKQLTNIQHHVKGYLSKFGFNAMIFTFALIGLSAHLMGAISFVTNTSTLKGSSVETVSQIDFEKKPGRVPDLGCVKPVTLQFEAVDQTTTLRILIVPSTEIKKMLSATRQIGAEVYRQTDHLAFIKDVRGNDIYIYVANSTGATREEINRDTNWRKRKEFISVITSLVDIDQFVKSGSNRENFLAATSIKVAHQLNKIILGPGITDEDVIRLFFVNSQTRFNALVDMFAQGTEIYDLREYEHFGAQGDTYSHLRHFAWLYWQEIIQIKELLRTYDSDREIVIMDLGTGGANFILTASHILTREELSRITFVGVDKKENDRRFGAEMLQNMDGLKIRWVTTDISSEEFTKSLPSYNADLIVSNHMLEYFSGNPEEYLLKWVEASNSTVMVSIPLHDATSENAHVFDLDKVEKIGKNVEADDTANVWLDRFDSTKYGGLWIFQKGSLLEYFSSRQGTLTKELEYSGKSLHLGKPVTMKIRPAEANTGFVFVKSKGEIRAIIENVYETVKATRLYDEKGGDILTPEHILSALGSVGINNAKIDLGEDGEPPIFDGSAAAFREKLLEPGTVKGLGTERKRFVVKQPIAFFREKEGLKMLVLPTKEQRLELSYFIEFVNPGVGAQYGSIIFNKKEYWQSIASSRTFIEAENLDTLLKMHRYLGIGKGEGAVLLDRSGQPIGPGFSAKDEAVRHKILDLFGDLQFAGFSIYGHIIAIEAGHRDHNELVRKIISVEKGEPYEEYDAMQREAILQKFLELKNADKIPESLYEEVAQNFALFTY